MKTWARRIAAFDEVPPLFQAAFPQSSGPFPLTVHLPEDRSIQSAERNNQLICMFADHFVLLEIQNGEMARHAVEFSDVLYLQRGLVLLNSWLKISTSSGVFNLQFNTVNELLFKPIIETLRRERVAATTHNGSASARTKPDLTPFHFLDKVNSKFMNYGRSSIQPDDKVLGMLYQPEQRLQTVRLFHKTFYQRYKTDHLVILTEKDLILIQETKRVRNNFEPRYGGVFTYIPRQKIQAVSFDPAHDAQDPGCTMNVTLTDDSHLAVEFSSSNEDLPGFQALWR